MNQESAFRRSRMVKILVCLCAVAVVGSVVCHLISSRNRIHESWEQSVKSMEQADHELSEKLHAEREASEERMLNSSVEKTKETLAQ